MTQPGSVIPPQPGWWVRTDRVGAALGATYGWATAAPTGATDNQGHGAGSYGWATADAVGLAPLSVTFKGVNASTTTSVTIPAHAVGDIIVIYAFRMDLSSINPPSAPTAAGTVPAWAVIDRHTGGDYTSSSTYYFVATATNHTSGTWANATAMAAAVLSHPSTTSSPIGGHAESGGSTTGAATAPAVTMDKTDGTSALLHFFGFNGTVTWPAAPTGYTKQISNNAVCVDTKNASTSDGAVTHTNNGGSSDYRGATVEVRSY